MNEQELKERAVEIVENNLYLLTNYLNGLFQLKLKTLEANPELEDEIEEQFKQAVLSILAEKLVKETQQDPMSVFSAIEDLDYNMLASYKVEDNEPET